MLRSVGRALLAALIGLTWCLAGPPGPAMAASTAQVGLYRVFEASVENHHSYENKFADVELLAPSGLIGKNLAEMDFRNRYGAIVLALVVGAVIMVLTSPIITGSLDPWLWVDAYLALIQGATGIAISDTLPAGLTFAAALRSILRQAPNIIMIGENHIIIFIIFCMSRRARAPL